MQRPLARSAGVARLAAPAALIPFVVLFGLFALALLAGPVAAQDRPAVEVSADGHETVIIVPSPTDGQVITRSDAVPYGTAPDWQNTLRRQVGALRVADMNGDGWADVVVGCYISNSYPPYTDWENLIYYNTGGALEADPSWVSADEVSTGDIEVALIDDDEYPDVFAANGGGLSYPSRIYYGGPGGPDPAPDWASQEPGGAWNNHALCIDIDHDGDTDVITANQGASPTDPSRPIFMFVNHDGALEQVPSWHSATLSIQGFLAAADYDGDGWEEVAVSKWSGYESGIYDNREGALQTSPIWTTGTTDSDKGVAWADVDQNGWPDLALGHSPTQVWFNDAGALAVGWESQASFFGHQDIAFCDVDHDGDEDLAETHFSNGQVHIYLNRDGVLDGPPSWTYDSPTVGTAIAFGDINGDQWPDLVVGNSGEPCVKVFYATPDLSAGPGGPEATPARLALVGNHPNPFNPSTRIVFELSAATAVDLEIFDPTGRRVRTLVRSVALDAGRHEAEWDGRDADGRLLPAGVYLCRLSAGPEVVTGSVVLVK
jgi:hypothetical protein